MPIVCCRWRAHTFRLLILIVCSLGAGSEDSAPELVIDSPSTGRNMLRPWESVYGRILRHTMHPPIYLVTSLWGHAGRVHALEVREPLLRVRFI